MFDRSVLERIDLFAHPKEIVSAVVPDLRYTANHEYLITQAQRRLQDRTEGELQTGAHYLEELFRAADRKAFDGSLTRLKAGSEVEFINDPIAFTELFQEFELDSQQDFPNATPITYFALLALIYALESLEYLRHYDDPKERERAAIGSMVIDRAKEMIAFIQGMEFEGIFRRKIATTANRARYQPYQALKRKIFDFVDAECAELSNRRAAQVAYLELRSEISTIMQSDDPEQQIAKWIGKHRRDQEVNNG